MEEQRVIHKDQVDPHMIGNALFGDLDAVIITSELSEEASEALDRIIAHTTAMIQGLAEDHDIPPGMRFIFAIRLEDTNVRETDNGN